jgi:hypothetical protein
VARTAVVAGTATAVVGHMSDKKDAQQQQAAEAQQWEQQQQWAAQQAAQPPPPDAPDQDPIELLKKYAALHDQGVLTDAEFEVQKAKILAG